MQRTTLNSYAVTRHSDRTRNRQVSEEQEGVPVSVAETVSESETARIREAVGSHWTLKAVVDWCLAQTPPILDADVVTQDEFTHDLIVPLPSGTHLVYDST